MCLKATYVIADSICWIKNKFIISSKLYKIEIMERTFNEKKNKEKDFLGQNKG